MNDAQTPEPKAPSSVMIHSQYLLHPFPAVPFLVAITEYYRHGFDLPTITWAVFSILALVLWLLKAMTKESTSVTQVLWAEANANKKD